jgi:fibronectin-binding autotransporter adhesin
MKRTIGPLSVSLLLVIALTGFGYLAQTQTEASSINIQTTPPETVEGLSSNAAARSAFANPDRLSKRLAEGVLTSALFAGPASGMETWPVPESLLEPSVTRTWDGGGATNNWSEPANWSSNTLPGLNDLAVFDNTSTKNATIDTNVSIAGLQLNSGYTGTISRGSSNLDIGATGYTQAAGALTGGGGAINIDGAFGLSGGTFTASSATTSFSSSFTVASPGVFTANAGTVLFDGPSNQFISIPASLSLAGLTINKTSGTLFFNTTSTVAVNGTLTLTDGVITNNSGTGTIDAQSAVSIASTFGGGNATLLIGGGAARTITLPAGVTMPALAVNAPNATLNTSGAGVVTFPFPVQVQSSAGFTNGTVDFTFNGTFTQLGGNFTGGNGTITANGIFSQSGGNFSGGSGPLDLENVFNLTGGTFAPGSGTTSFASNMNVNNAGVFSPNAAGVAVFDGGSNQFITIPPSLAFASLTINKTSGSVFFNSTSTMLVNGTLSLTDGTITNNSGSGTVESRGPVSIAPTFNGGTATLLIGGNAARTISLPAGVTMPAFIVNAPNATLNTSGAGTVTFAFPVQVQSSSGFTNGAVNFIFNGAFSQSGGNFTGGNGTITLKGNFTQSGGSFTGGGGLLDVDSAFNLSGGTFAAGTNTTSFSSSLNVSNPGVFDPNGGTVLFDEGSNQFLTIPASLPFANLTINKASGSVFFNTTSSMMVDGTLALTDGTITNNSGNGTLDARGPVSIASTFGGGTATLLIAGSAARTVTVPVGAVMPRLTVNAPNVTLNGSGAGTVTFPRPVDVLSAAGITNGAADFTFDSTFTQSGGTVTGGSGTFNTNGAFTQSGGTFTGGAGPLDFDGDFDLSGGTFAAAQTTTFAGSFEVGNPAVFNANGGIAVFDGGSNQFLTVPPTLSFANLTVNKTSGSVFFNTTSTLVVGGALSLTNGAVTNNSGTGTVEARDAVSVASTFYGGTSSFTFGGSNNQTYANSGGTNPTGAWTVNKPAGTVSLLNALDLSNGSADLVLTNGTITTGANSVIAGLRNVTRTNGFVNGALRRSFSFAQPRSFDVGTTAGYAPVIVNATSGSFGAATFSVRANEGTLAGASPTQSLTRSWSLDPGPSGITTANLTFQYQQADVPAGANEALFTFLRRSAGVTVSQGITSLDTTTNVAVLNGVNTFSDWSLGVVGGQSTPTPTATATPEPTASPTPASGSISGVVTYGTTPSANPVQFVPGASLTATGLVPAGATTNAAGAYSLSGLGPGAYTVTPAKSGDVNGVSGLDAARVAQHVAGLIALTPNQQLAGDATNNGSLSGLDAARIAQTVAGLPNPGFVGQWKFLPPSRNYASITGSLTNQNYEAILIGDVTGNWAPTPAPRPDDAVDLEADYTIAARTVPANPDRADGSAAGTGVLEVEIPANISAAPGEPLTIPIQIGDTTGKGILAYDFTLEFDPDVIRPMLIPTDATGTLSQEWTIVHNTKTPGRIRLTAFSTAELTGRGTLLNLRFSMIAWAPGSAELRWCALELNEGEVRTRSVPRVSRFFGLRSQLIPFQQYSVHFETASGVGYGLVVG